MNLRTAFLLGLLFFLGAAFPAEGADHYAAVNGTSSGDGSIGNPWDLQTALNQPPSVVPGDTIWLRGGVYHSSSLNGFFSMLNGTVSSPIIVRNYNGEHVSIDGHGANITLGIYGSYTWFWGLELADFEGQATGPSPSLALGIGIYAPGIKCINLVVHDTSQGVSAFNDSPDAELYGNLVYYNGYVASGRNAGHGLYLQNLSGLKTVWDNFVGDNADENIQIYGSGAADLIGFDIEGNSLYNSSSWPTPNYQYNLIIAGGTNRKNITFKNNFSFFPLSSGLGYLTFGQYTQGQDITIQNNVFAGGFQPVEVSDQAGPVIFSGNTLVAGNASQRMILLDTFPSLSGYTWTNNTYYDATGLHFDVDRTGTSGLYETFASWQSANGFDSASTYSTSLPTGPWVYARPNKYESKRANITIYNWNSSPSVAVDLSSILSSGDQFVIQNAQNFYGPAVVQGTYQGGTVSVPMSGLTKATPIGFNAPAHTAPQFGTFVLIPISGSPIVSNATFVGTDPTTQGNWAVKYGSDGYSIANFGQLGPAYANVTVQNALLWTWSARTADPRALRMPGSTSGIASTWYNNPQFTYDVSVTDGKTHQIALYGVDWDSTTRAETVRIVDGNNPSHILDTETVANYSNGAYLVWNISGHVMIQVTTTAGANAVISGIFFGSASAVAPQIISASSAAFTVGSAGAFTVTATGNPIPGLSESGNLPSGVTFNTSTGSLSGTPASGSNGSYPLTFTASNGVSPTATQGFTLTVNQNTQAPAITSAPGTTFTVGTAGTFTVTATGNPTPALSETGGLPTGVTFNTSTGVLSGTPATGTGGSYSVTVTASNGVGSNASQSFTLLVSTPISGGNGNGVTFLGSDTTTQGNWQKNYGTDGYAIANFSQVVPTYAALSAPGALLYTWASSTGDPRALQLPDGSTRIASAWYNRPGFSYDLNITDGNAHRVAFYAMDWDSNTRAETIQIVDASNPSNVLDTKNISNFQNGIYLIWTIQGHVKINVTWSAGSNAAINGIFFGSPASASFISADTITQGNWAGKFGSDGYSIANYGQSLPSYAAVSSQNAFTYTWTAATSDSRALKVPNSSMGFASAWYNNPAFGFDLALKDGNPHQVAVYLLDWDGQGTRAETIQVVDANSNAVLSTQSASSFANGRYLVWSISGHVRIVMTATGGANAVVSGVFFK